MEGCGEKVQNMNKNIYFCIFVIYYGPLFNGEGKSLELHHVAFYPPTPLLFIVITSDHTTPIDREPQYYNA